MGRRLSPRSSLPCPRIDTVLLMALVLRCSCAAVGDEPARRVPRLGRAGAANSRSGCCASQRFCWSSSRRAARDSCRRAVACTTCRSIHSSRSWARPGMRAAFIALVVIAGGVREETAARVPAAPLRTATGRRRRRSVVTSAAFGLGHTLQGWDAASSPGSWAHSGARSIWRGAASSPTSSATRSSTSCKSSPACASVGLRRLKRSAHSTALRRRFHNCRRSAVRATRGVAANSATRAARRLGYRSNLGRDRR